MIFAAGLGTRLHPVTEEIPKALVEVGGQPLLRRVTEKLVAAGILEIVVNVHHFPEMIRHYLHDHPYPGVTFHISDESGELLDTGGGLMKAAPWLAGDEPVVVHNVDVISDLDIAALVEYHRQKRAVATLAVRARETQRYLLFDREMRLSGWMNHQSGEIRRPGPVETSPNRPENKWSMPSDQDLSSSGTAPGSHESAEKAHCSTAHEPFALQSEEGSSNSNNEIPGLQKDELPLAFSGIHVIDPAVFTLVTRRGRFSLIDAYLELAATAPVFGYRDLSPHWIDVGKPDQLRQADEWLSSL